jgi:hypothetical protein
MKALIPGFIVLLIANITNGQSVNLPDAMQVAINNRQEVPVTVNLPIVVPGVRDGDEPVRSKTFTKSFAVNQSDKVSVINQYGTIQIKTWDRKEVKVDVDIKAYSNSDTESQALLNQVSIDADKEGDQVILTTRMGKGTGGNWGSGNRNGKKWRREVKINYVVYMPATLALTMAQSYGNISVPELSGAVSVRLQYGDFSAISLNSTNNYINVQYGKTSIQTLNKGVIKQQYGPGLTIGIAGTLDLDAQYAAVNINTIKGSAIIKQQYGSGLVLGIVENLDIKAQYADVTVNTVRGNAKIDQQYSNLNIGTVLTLNLNAEYTSATIGTLRGNAKIDMQYNRLSIGEVTNGCRALTLEGSYLNSTINFNDNFNADFDVNISYAPFKYGERVSAKINGEKNSNTKKYAGSIGNGGGAVVKINSSYGSVTFK